MKSTLIRSALLLPLLISTPLQAAKQPAWVNGSDPAFPDATYLRGIGVGNDLDSARSNARAEISKVFQARVQQTSQETQTESSQSLGKKSGPALGAQQTALNTTVSTDSLLEGVQIAQTYFNKKNKKYYALAILDKPVTRRGLTFQITDKEQAVQTRMSQAQSAATPLEKARALSQAVQLSGEKDELSARRRVVDGAAVPDIAAAGASTAELDRSLRETLGGIQFLVDADGGEDSHLKEAVTEKITAMGFKVAGADGASLTQKGPVLRIKCRMTLEPFDRGNPSWKFFQWNGTFELSENGPGGKVLASSAPSGSEGHITESTARTKTRTAGEEAMAKEAQVQISRYIFGTP